MRNRLLTQGLLSAVALASLGCINAYAARVRITVESLNPDNGLWFSPVFLGFHDGSFDMFDQGSPASAAIEAIAELGDSSGLVSAIGSVAGATSAVLKRGAPDSVPPAALFAPGTMNSIVLELNPALNRFLSFASMVVPSNDAFFGNDNPMGYELFDAGGSLHNGMVINLTGLDVWDSGTEENTGFGAAFSLLGGVDTPTIGGVVSQHPGLDNFVGTALPIGEDLGAAFGATQPLARITIEQVPDATPYIGLLSLLGLVGFRCVAGRRTGSRLA